jgi:hypothetical protein
MFVRQYEISARQFLLDESTDPKAATYLPGLCLCCPRA